MPVLWSVHDVGHMGECIHPMGVNVLPSIDKESLLYYGKSRPLKDQSERAKYPTLLKHLFLIFIS